jgi:hypothetical protein
MLVLVRTCRARLGQVISVYVRKTMLVHVISGEFRIVQVSSRYQYMSGYVRLCKVMSR